jgi:hypothetical protein
MLNLPNGFILRLYLGKETRFFPKNQVSEKGQITPTLPQIDLTGKITRHGQVAAIISFISLFEPLRLKNI